VRAYPNVHAGRYSVAQALIGPRAAYALGWVPARSRRTWVRPGL